MNEKKSQKHTKRQNFIRKSLEAADGLSLGISMVVAVFLGIGIGLLLEKFTPYPWLFWLGVFWGVAAALLNVYRAYKMQVKSYEEFSQRDKNAEEIRKNNET